MASETSSSAVRDDTFRSYSAEQAKLYATHRPAYEPSVYDVIFKHHFGTGGQSGLVVDVGCGPGNATRDVALLFDEAIGIDPGQSMIEAARKKGGKTKSGKDIKYVVMPAEELSTAGGLQPNSVDLLTAATAAHWFEMDKFWPQAARVLKPGGTVALWILSGSFCHPDTPNAAVVAENMRKYREALKPYTIDGNLLAKDMYDDMTLPWEITPPVTAFPKSSYIKHEFDRDGVLSNSPSCFGGWKEFTLKDAEYILGTTSQVTRWREAHPDLVGTDKDILKAHLKDLGNALPADQQKIRAGTGIAILLFKKVEN